MTIIDIHAHAIPRTMVAAMREAHPDHAPELVEREDGTYLQYARGRKSGPIPQGMLDVAPRLADMDERGVDVRGLVWRSHLDQTGFFATENRHFGEQLQARGAEVLLDMRVRTGGSHHQKLVVVRHRDDPSRDVHEFMRQLRESGLLPADEPAAQG